MRAILGTEEVISVGRQKVIGSVSPSTPFAVVFEDDGQAAYFHGLDRTREDNAILDALHIYNVQSVKDRNISSKVTIIWSADGLKSALLINEYPHAVFDKARLLPKELSTARSKMDKVWA